MRVASIITLHKNKGDRSDCIIIVTSALVGKVFARVNLARLQGLASPEFQGQSIYSGHDLRLTPIARTLSRAAMATLHRNQNTADEMLPPKPPGIITSIHEGMHSVVYFKGAISKALPMSCGMRQGSILAPTLLGILFSVLLRYVLTSTLGASTCTHELMADC